MEGQPYHLAISVMIVWRPVVTTMGFTRPQWADSGHNWLDQTTNTCYEEGYCNNVRIMLLHDKCYNES